MELFKKRYKKWNKIEFNKVIIEKELNEVSIDNIINEIDYQAKILENADRSNENGKEKTLNQFARELYKKRGKVFRRVRRNRRI